MATTAFSGSSVLVQLPCSSSQQTASSVSSTTFRFSSCGQPSHTGLNKLRGGSSRDFSKWRRARKVAATRSMAPDDEKMTRRSPLDFPVEWDRPSPGRRPDIFPQFSPMKTPLPPPLPADPPEEDEEEDDKKEEDPDKEPEKPEE